MLGEINIELDKLGRAKKVIDYKGRETKYKLGAFGERLELEYPDGKKVKYNYDDELNLIKLISDSKEINYAYDDYGRLIRKDMPEEISSIYTYNERGFLESLIHLQKERKLEKHSYLYDLAGNKTCISKKRSVQEVYIDVEDPEKIEEKLWEDSAVFNYEYDKLNSLISVKKDSKKLHSYSYDAFGNRLTFESKDSNIQYIYNALDQLVEEKGVYPNRKYSYDKRGNLKSVLSGGELIRGYEYDTSDRLGLSYDFSGRTKSYIYDGLGNRIGDNEYIVEKDDLKDVSKDILQELDIVSEEEYLLDITRPYHNLLQKNEKFRNIKHSQSFIWDYNTAFMEEKDKTYAYLQDELGSPIRLFELGETGETKQMVYGYDEFGVDTYKTQGKIQPFGYTGYRHDKVADTYFAQAREYMPSVGRFGGEDWIKGNIDKPFSLNQYGYCFGNPMNWVDRNGKYPETPLANVPVDKTMLLSEPKKSENIIQEIVKDITKVDITETESTLILLAPKEAMIVKDAAKEADEWTDKIFGGYYKALDDKGPHWRDGDAANAYRHAMWNALMTKYFLTNATTAQIWASAHEEWPDEILDMMHEGGFKRRVHTEMDLHNNAEGRKAVKFGELFISNEEISNRIIQKLRNGELKVLINYGWYDEFFKCETSK